VLVRLARWLALCALIAGMLFGLAGRLDLWRLWVTVAVMAATLLLALFLIDPKLTQERLKRNQKTADPVVLALIRVTALSVFIVAPLDVGRFHWSGPVPAALSVAALAALAGAFVFALTAVRVNRFFLPQVRIQTERGHHVVDRGPYAVVRHPGYAAMTVFAPAAALAMGSWVALGCGAACAASFIFRAAREDRFLHRNLEGYAEYARRVPYRVVPGLW
jgi:protein-S-isoprenylcysteine O-methyltransferase Ste14